MELGPPRGEADLVALSAILGWSFGFEPADALARLDHGGTVNVRVARRGERVLGGLLEVPMGQWFGGQSISMLGVAGVAVAPEARGEGVALALVLDALRSARRRGVLLSALYPATLSLYRGAGYELAGARYRLTAKLSELPRTRVDLDVSPLEPADVPAVEALYRRVASERPGYLDRGPYVWRRVRQSRQQLHHGYAVRGAGGLEGYAYLSQRPLGEQRDLVVHDLQALTPAALKRLLAFFADHQTTLEHLIARGAAADSVAFVVPERAFQIELADEFMLRVLDAPAALAARGYPPVDASVDLELADRTLPDNAGRYRLEVAGGRARVTPGGRGAVGLDERALAALYSGYLSPGALARLGRLEGERDALERLAVLFAGPAPAMGDYF